MIAERLELWRLANFALERLPSADGRLSVPRRRPRERARRAAGRGRRGARPDAGARRGRPRHRRCPSSSGCSARRSRRCARPGAPAAARAACSGTAVLYVWPTIDFEPERRARSSRRFAPPTVGLGLELVLLRAGCATARRRRARPRAALLQPGRARRRRRDRRPADASRCSRSTRAPSGSSPRAARGMVHPAEIVKLLAPARAVPAADPGRRVRRARPRRRAARSCPVDRPPATNTASIVVGARLATAPSATRRACCASSLLGDPTRALGSLAEPECRRVIAALDLAERARRAVRVVRAVRRRQDRHGLRHREHGLGRRRAAPDRRVHPGRRRDQRRRHRHQRRRPAVLERRGDDAHAHQGHPRDDARQRDGADRQAGARLLRRRVGRGQLRHRRLRADHGPERPGAVLGARPRRRLRRSCSPTTSTPTSRPGERFPRRAHDRRPASTATSARRRTTRPAPTSRRVGEIFSEETNPGRKKPFDIRSVMRAVIDADHAPLERWAGHARGRDRGRVGRPPRRLARSRMLGIESRPLPRLGADAGRRPGAVDVGHAVPARLEEGRPRDQRGVRAAAARRAGQPRRLRRLAGVDAPAAARVRRRDRPRDRQLRRADRVLRHLALPRRRVRGVLARAQRATSRRSRSRARTRR